MSVFLYLICLLFYHACTGEHIDCTQGSKCTSSTVTCSETAESCIIDCRADNACKASTINCNHGQNCIIVTDDSINCVRKSIIHCPHGANCIFNGTQGDGGFRDAEIHCGIGGSCYFVHSDSGGTHFHWFSLFNATHSTYIKIRKSGDWTSSNLGSTVYCPNNGHGGEPSCELECDTDKACDFLNIYAVEGFHDINITDTYWATSTRHASFYQSYMHCGKSKDDTYSCNVDAENPNQCNQTGVSSDLTCSNYLTPTFEPSE